MFACPASSCGWRDESPAFSGEPPADLAQHLAADAALAVNDREEFRFPPAAAPGDVPIISAERAGVGFSVASELVAGAAAPMERDRGAPIAEGAENR
ncbi:MAG: hypothetical protein KY467_12450 [Gemmatimonadetes bacterium]|nr:hypothetical protein [Gemmatimonadota bacterium]